MMNELVSVGGATPASVETDAVPMLLRDCGLMQVAIVDDYYDPPEQLELNPRDATDLWALLEFDSDARAELAALGVNVSAPDDLTGAVLSTFFGHQDQCPQFADLWRKSIPGHAREEQSKQLEQIVMLLRDTFALSVVTFGRDTSVTEMTNCGAQLFLLDWRLGEDFESAVEAAVGKAKEIIAQWPTTRPRPLIVLMSSAPDIRDHAEEFRRRSHLLGGMFHAVPKGELGDEFSLQMHLQMLGMSLQSGHQLQGFVDALREKVRTVGNEFVERISALTLTDYAYIQSLSLQRDGQPLGDYLIWLFSTYFGQLLFGCSLREQREKLDALRFSPLPSQHVPSTQLAELYQYALFDMDVGPITGHPHTERGSIETPRNAVSVTPGDISTQMDAATDPMLGLGDVFVLDDAVLPGTTSDPVGTPEREKQPAEPDLMMIVNAQCDLAFSPDSNPARMIERGRSVLLLPGTLSSIWEPIPDKYRTTPRTELCSFDGHSYRVFWHTKEITTVPYGAFRNWHDGKGAQAFGRAARHKRIARLRQPYALEVQRALAADFTRVGLPTAPPICQTVNVRVMTAQNKRYVEEVQLDASEVAFLILTRGDNGPVQQCVLTLPLVHRLKKVLQRRLSELEDGSTVGGLGTGQQGHLASQVDALRRAILSSAKWGKLLVPIEIPGEKGAGEYLGGHLHIVRNKSLGDECVSSKVVVAVSIQEIDR